MSQIPILQMKTIKNINDYKVLNDSSPNVTDFEQDSTRYEKYMNLEIL